MNSSKLLALSLVLFLGACSATPTLTDPTDPINPTDSTDLTLEEKFLIKVRDKFVYLTADSKLVQYQFSSDGKEITDMTFDQAIDENTGLYKGVLSGGIKLQSVIMTLDGNTGTTQTTESDIEAEQMDLWLTETLR